MEMMLVLLPVLLLMVSACPELPHEDLTCFSDYNRNITCIWNHSYPSDRPDAVCTLHAWNQSFGYANSCKLEPVDGSRPALAKCSVVFEHEWTFQSFHLVNISVSCDATRRRESILYQPSCHIKLSPPPKPDINRTVVHWRPQAVEHRRLRSALYQTELQWRVGDGPWPVRAHHKECRWNCDWMTPLPDELKLAEKFDVRVRVKIDKPRYKSVWSDWSPVASWVSPNGRATPTPPNVSQVVLVTSACAVSFLLFLILFKIDKTTWVYIVKKIRGRPLPNPGKSFLQDGEFQNWLGPHFTSESFHSFLKPVEIVSVEVTSLVDAVGPGGLEATLRKTIRSKLIDELTTPSFSNPMYSHLSPVAAPVLLTAGNLEACDSDAPYGPVGCHVEGQQEQDVGEAGGRRDAVLRWFSEGNTSNSETIPVISDYKNTEKPQLEHPRLQSVDSGLGSSGPFGHDSLEDDSIDLTDDQSEGSDGGQGTDGDVQKLLRTGGGFNAIQVCSGYKVLKIDPDRPDLQDHQDHKDYQDHQNHQDPPDDQYLPSLDSGISSGEQVSQEEELDSSDFLFPPVGAPFRLLAGSSFAQVGSGSRGRPLPGHILATIALASADSSLAPSGDGYMPVRQEQTLQHA
ncbi:uncharacterized protein [Antennarius striatus]|uniref:uncharacterized protein n=1 Tax=Antennarius striatus TaxID=241820 RepID=UPI0035AE3E4B